MRQDLVRTSCSSCLRGSETAKCIHSVIACHDISWSPACVLPIENYWVQGVAEKSKDRKSLSALPQGFLSEVFAGQLSSTVTCQTCHHQSTTLEPFMDLSLPVPVDTLAQLESFDRHVTLPLWHHMSACIRNALSTSCNELLQPMHQSRLTFCCNDIGCRKSNRQSLQSLHVVRLTALPGHMTCFLSCMH